MKTPAVMVGLAVGDALGMPFEKLNEEVHPLLDKWWGDYREGTFHKLPAGHYTDDTEMALCLAQTLDEFDVEAPDAEMKNPFDVKKAAEKYLAWSKGTPHGMGGSTRNAMGRLEAGVPCHQSGESFLGGPDTVGSGTAMRIAPMGLYFSGYTWLMEQNVKDDSRVTHRDTEAFIAALAVAYAVKFAADGVSGGGLIERVIDHLSTGHLYTTKVYERLVHAKTLYGYREPPSAVVERGVLGRRGNAWQIVTTAIYCAAYHSQVANSYPYFPNQTLPKDGFKHGVIEAIRLGGDTDTRGAITGAILGALYGSDGIPDEYKKGLKDYAMLKGLDERLWEKRVKGPKIPCATCIKKRERGFKIDPH